MVCKPASSVMATNGIPRQMLAAMTDARALFGSPRKSMLLSKMPVATKNQLMIESWAS